MGSIISPSRHPEGISVHGAGALKNLPVPTFKNKWLVEWNDFTNYVAGDWTVTETQAEATQALLDEQGGWLRLANTAADNDVNQIQKKGEAWKLVAGKKTMFEARIRCSEATQTDWHVGLIITDTDLVGGVTDGIYFRKDDGDANIDFTSLKNSAGTTSTAIATSVANTAVKLGFYFNGAEIFVFVNDVQKYRNTAPTFVDDEELCITFSQTNGDGNARNFDIDYYCVAQEINR